jgi:hypothetical protein
MSRGYLQPGQDIGNQSETNVTIAQNVNGKLNVPGGRLKVSNVPIGSVAYSSFGTSTTNVIQLWTTDILVPYNRVVSNIAFLQGSGSVTDNWIGVIYDSFGNIVASTALAGQAQSGASTFQVQAIGLVYTFNPATNTWSSATATSVSLYGPQQYYVGIQIDNTSANAINLVATNTFLDVCCGAITAGTFGTIPNTITPITTFTALKGPIAYLS